MLVAELIQQAADAEKGSEAFHDELIERARKWLDRIHRIKYFASWKIEDLLMYSITSNPTGFGSLDFDTGDVVRVMDGKSPGGALAVVSMHWDRLDSPPAHVIVLYASTGKPAEVPWRYLAHAKIPEELLQIARAQLKAQLYDCETAD